jgi:fibronectin type 3 domain-containing protein
MNQMVAGDKLTVNPGTYREQINPINNIELVLTAGVIIKGSDVVTGWQAVSGGLSNRFVVAWTTESQQAFVTSGSTVTKLQQIGGRKSSAYSNGSFPPTYPNESPGVWGGKVAGDETTMPLDSFYHKVSTGQMFIRVTGGISGKTIELSKRGFLLHAFDKHDVILNAASAKFTHSNSTSRSHASTPAALRILGDRWYINIGDVIECDGQGLLYRGNDSEILGRYNKNGQLGVAMTGRNLNFHNFEANENNTEDYEQQWEAGGVKCIGSSPIDGVSGWVGGKMTDWVCAKNNGSGLWWDTNPNAGSMTVERGIACYNGPENIFFENSRGGIFRHIYSFGAQLRGMYMNGAGTLIERNLVAFNGSRTIMVTLDTRLSGGPINNTVRRNLIAWNNPGKPTEHDLTLPESIYSGNTSNFNLWVEASGLPQLARQAQGQWNGLTAWRAATGLDQGSWERVLAIVASMQSAINSKTINIDWTPLFNVANDVNPSDPPGPAQGAAPPAGPAVPTGLNVTAGDTTANMTWNTVAGAVKYGAKHGTTNGGPYSNVQKPTAPPWLKTNLINGQTYYFVVSAIDANDIESANSPEFAATPTAGLPAAPLAPTGLTAAAGNAEVQLNWTAAAGSPTSYTVKWGTSNGGPYPNTITGIITTSRLVTGLTNGTPHYFVASASNDGGESPNSTQASATPIAPVLQPPDPPTGLNVEPQNQALSASWNASPNALEYTVKWGTTAGGPYPDSQTGITDTNFLIPNLINGTTYRVVVSASNADGESANSNEFAATPQASVSLPPPPPENLIPIAGDGNVFLGWNASQTALSYTVKWGTISGGPYPNSISDLTVTNVLIEDLENGLAHYFIVTASNNAGEGLSSAEVSATPQEPLPEPEPEEEPEAVLKLKTGTQQIVTA